MSESTRWIVPCPCCEATLHVDRKTGAVIWSDAKPKASPTLGEMVRRLDQQKETTAARVKQEQQALKDRSRVLEEKVKESMKRIDPDAKPPLRPIDLD